MIVRADPAEPRLQFESLEYRIRHANNCFIRIILPTAAYLQLAYGPVPERLPEHLPFLPQEVPSDRTPVSEYPGL